MIKFMSFNLGQIHVLTMSYNDKRKATLSNKGFFEKIILFGY